MRKEQFIIEDLYHALQHIESDLDNDIAICNLNSIHHTVQHCIKKIENYFDERDARGK